MPGCDTAVVVNMSSKRNTEYEARRWPRDVPFVRILRQLQRLQRLRLSCCSTGWAANQFEQIQIWQDQHRRLPQNPVRHSGQHLESGTRPHDTAAARKSAPSALARKVSPSLNATWHGSAP